jgi:predicted metal-dependent hydrolase
VVVPRGVAPNVVKAFVARNTSWIDRKVAEMGRIAGPALQMPESVEFAATGERIRVQWRQSSERSWRQEQNLLIVEAKDLAAAYVVLREWLLSAARDRLVPMIAALAQQLGCSLTGVIIRRQRTRWGSCSSRGSVSLNCALMFMQPEVVRYLMIHELSHLAQMNHSERFWRTVEHHEPNYRALDRQLTAGWRGVPAWVFKG